MKNKEVHIIRKNLYRVANRELEEAQACLKKIVMKYSKMEGKEIPSVDRYYEKLENIKKDIDFALLDGDLRISVDDVIDSVNNAKRLIINFIVYNKIPYMCFRDMICNNSDGSYRFFMLADICIRRPEILNQIYICDKQLCQNIIHEDLIYDESFCRAIKSTRLIKPQIKKEFGIEEVNKKSKKDSLSSANAKLNKQKI